MGRVAPYPLITCADHAGDPLPGYAICLHAARNAKVDLAPIVRATTTSLGVIACKRCARAGLTGKNATTCCAHAAQERFGIPL